MLQSRLDSGGWRRYTPAMQERRDSELAFIKMHGLGNDFVIVDARRHDPGLSADLARRIADRHFGVGFDQLAVIETGSTDASLVFYNADGSLSAACGNATRCIARHLMDQSGRSELILTTARGDLQARDAGAGAVSVNMGQPQTGWRDIPLAQDVDTLHLPIRGDPVATGMGNPHCTFFVPDAEAVDLAEFGRCHESHPLFPQRTNVQVAQILGPDHIRMRVWERGVGVTLASGSSSCATTVAASRRGLTGRSVRVDLDGGTLSVDWRQDGVWMTGPATHVFTGRLTREFLEGRA